MATKQIRLEGLGLVTLYKRRGNRSIRLSLSGNGEVRVSIPNWLPYKAGEQFVLSKRGWILSHKSTAKPRLLAHGQQIGKSHRLYFEPRESLLRVSTRLGNGQIRVNHPLASAVHDEIVQQAARRVCIRALRREAEELLPGRLRRLSEQTGLPFNSVSVKQLKSRWGSCSSTRDITLNLFLMQLPWHLIDYVLVHELTHTKVMRHGPPFWQELQLHAPDAKQLRKEIAVHQPILMTLSA